VVPGEHEHDRQPGDERQQRDLPYLLGPVEGLADVLEALQEPPGGGDVDHSPLHHLPAAQPGPRAIAPTLCRRVVHSAAPRVAGSVSEPRPRGAADGGPARRGSGNLETWVPTAGLGGLRISGFQILSFSPPQRGPDGGAACGYRRAHSHPAHLRHRSGRVGRTRAAAVSSPMARRRAPLAGAGM
jgi:hypothetical protein